MKTATWAPLPYDLGVTLPMVQRLTDARFRRVCRWFSVRKLDPETAVELYAFLELMPYKWSKWIFKWEYRWMPHMVKRLQAHEPYRLAAQVAIEANLHALSVDNVLAILTAMQEGGWTTKHQTPKIIKDALRELRASGVSCVEIAKRTGLPYDRVRDYTGRRDGLGRGQRRASLLAVG